MHSVGLTADPTNRSQAETTVSGRRAPSNGPAAHVQQLISRHDIVAGIADRQVAPSPPALRGLRSQRALPDGDDPVCLAVSCCCCCCCHLQLCPI